MKKPPGWTILQGTLLFSSWSSKSCFFAEACRHLNGYYPDYFFYSYHPKSSRQGKNSAIIGVGNPDNWWTKDCPPQDCPPVGNPEVGIPDIYPEHGGNCQRIWWRQEEKWLILLEWYWNLVTLSDIGDFLSDIDIEWHWVILETSWVIFRSVSLIVHASLLRCSPEIWAAEIWAAEIWVAEKLGQCCNLKI